jgi:hypothetical protein
VWHGWRVGKHFGILSHGRAKAHLGKLRAIWDSNECRLGTWLWEGGMGGRGGFLEFGEEAIVGDWGEHLFGINAHFAVKASNLKLRMPPKQNTSSMPSQSPKRTTNALLLHHRTSIRAAKDHTSILVLSVPAISANMHTR